MPDRKIRLAILDDHQSIIDGYQVRLAKDPQIEIVGAAYDGVALEGLLARQPADLVILDLVVPTSADNTRPYPILNAIPRLKRRHPALALLVITMVGEPTLVRSVISAGANGYILKGDLSAIKALAAIVRTVAEGGAYISPAIRDFLPDRDTSADGLRLTPRQLEAVRLCAADPGSPLAELAGAMSISESTLGNLLSGAYARLGVRNRAEAIFKAQALGLIGQVLPHQPFGPDAENV